MTTEAIKTCCAEFYASDWVHLLVGNSLHPGGLALTERLGVLLGLDAHSRVLDLATGPGASAVHLAQVFGCHVVGVDYSAENVAQAEVAAEREAVADRVEFQQADAEQLAALPDQAFNAVICECAFCTFPNKPGAAREIARVLVPDGRFGLSDLTRDGEPSVEFDGNAGWIACLADAQPVADYIRALQAAGLHVTHVEDHHDALAEMVSLVQRRLLVAQIVTRIEHAELPSGVDLQQAKTVARRAADGVRAGELGYTLLIASRDARQ
ncbi:MAG: class I SAM-dependent methyltransferase [Chloroflexi bacterium]|nr:class I SAM-dependent methyltransferase [Chloroflexota bacterium]